MIARSCELAAMIKHFMYMDRTVACFASLYNATKYATAPLAQWLERWSYRIGRGLEPHKEYIHIGASSANIAKPATSTTCNNAASRRQNEQTTQSTHRAEPHNEYVNAGASSAKNDQTSGAGKKHDRNREHRRPAQGHTPFFVFFLFPRA